MAVIIKKEKVIKKQVKSVLKVIKETPLPKKIKAKILKGRSNELENKVQQLKKMIKDLKAQKACN